MAGAGTRAGALAGVAAEAAALGAAELIAALVNPRGAPLVAVGGVVVDTVPESGKELAINLFGTYDKTALLIGTALVLTLVAMGVGAAATRRTWVGYLGIGLFALVGAVAAATRAGAGPAWVLPSLLGGGASAVVLWWLLRYAAAAAADGVADGVVEGTADGTGGNGGPGAGSGDRRAFLRGTSMVMAGAAVAGFGGRSLGRLRGVSEARAAITLPTVAAPSAPAGAELGIDGLTRYTISNADFYRIDTAFVLPRVDPASWRLRIHGQVAKPLTLSYEDLINHPMIERYVTLACVSNEVGGHLIGNARWRGVPVADLLALARPDPGADQVVSRSVDGFTAGTPTAALVDGRDAMIAVGMNGEPLPERHGFPARLVVPGLYGYVSATKWLSELELTTFAEYDAYWVRRGWAPQAPVKTQSRIDVPAHRATVAAGTVVVAGVAWAQHRGISAVQVRVDTGEWLPASLAETASIDTWRQWSWQWSAQPGEHTLSVRAVDNTGEPQPPGPGDPFPDGALGWHTIRVAVV